MKRTPSNLLRLICLKRFCPLPVRSVRSLAVAFFGPVVFSAACWIASPRCSADDAVDSTEQADYERGVKPLLFQKCVACHGALRQQAGLRLDAGELIRRGGESGPAVIVGQSATSLLIERVTAADHSAAMPPEGQGEKLSDVQVNLLKAWIDQGAISPANEKVPEDPAKYWSYQRPARPNIPPVSNPVWVRNPVDAFIAAQHQQRGLAPSPEAPREVWLRRVCLDLIGLPPNPQEREAFLQDQSPDAYERVVDHLLARPEYGERWGRHWMDVWRYSDWYGSRAINEIRYSQRHIWRWRDWIVDSLNNDKPYEQMVAEMLAGDELAPTDPDVLRATGFLGRNWYKFDRNVWMFDTVEQTSQAFLGLTLKCARCHDHKFDPITQEDYYHFRAFFEPHHLRTDPVSANVETEKDATLGPVLKEGLARAFDKELEAKTFVFQRGDDRYKDESKVMTPAVPAALGQLVRDIQPVQLPPESWYPQLHPTVASSLVLAADSRVAEAEAQIKKALNAAEKAAEELRDWQDRSTNSQAETVGISPVLYDDFQTQQSIWSVTSGNWTWGPGTLTESSTGSFSTVVANVVHPRNFEARVKYRTMQPGSYRSVGFSFDHLDSGNSQDVYTSVNDTAPSIQAFHRRDGQQVYPSAGIVQTKLNVGEVTTVDITVRDQQLSLRLNGELKLEYIMPEPRRDGKFALWTHNGSAEFLEVDLRELQPDEGELQQRLVLANQQQVLADSKAVTARNDATALRARIEAERSKYFSEPADVAQQKALAASKAERVSAVSKQREEVIIAEQFLEQVRSSLKLSEQPATPPTSLAEAEKKLSDAQQKHIDAGKALELADGTYTPLGETFPRSSTGRRLALARWITDPQNPRSSRIAVNQMWMRHFGEAIVPSVANFGLNGQQPSHPELLDWLALELIKNGWRMKPLHKLIVLSSTYRQSSATAADALPLTASTIEASPTVASDAITTNAAIDPANRFLWRMNSRRMEAETVRDSLLFVAGSLNLQKGGPEIPETEAESVFRRSLYFRSTPNEKSSFLETFDAANPNECYRRQESVVPQQALALMNSSLALGHARKLSAQLNSRLEESDTPAAQAAFIQAAFESILARTPTGEEVVACQRFLRQNTLTNETAALETFPAGNVSPQQSAATVPFLRARENLVHVLFSHNDFITIR